MDRTRQLDNGDPGYLLRYVAGNWHGLITTPQFAIKPAVQPEHDSRYAALGMLSGFTKQGSRLSGQKRNDPVTFRWRN